MNNPCPICGKPEHAGMHSATEWAEWIEKYYHGGTQQFTLQLFNATAMGIKRAQAEARNSAIEDHQKHFTCLLKAEKK